MQIVLNIQIGITVDLWILSKFTFKPSVDDEIFYICATCGILSVILRAVSHPPSCQSSSELSVILRAVSHPQSCQSSSELYTRNVS